MRRAVLILRALFVAVTGICLFSAPQGKAAGIGGCTDPAAMIGYCDIVQGANLVTAIA